MSLNKKEMATLKALLAKADLGVTPKSNAVSVVEKCKTWVLKTHKTEAKSVKPMKYTTKAGEHKTGTAITFANGDVYNVGTNRFWKQK